MEKAFELHAYYSKLFEAFAALPTDDIGSALFEQSCELWADSPWRDFGCFLDRVEAYLEAYQLSPARHEKVVAFLAKQKPYYERCLWLPEKRPRVIELDRADLESRQLSLDIGNTFLFLDDVKRSDSVEQRKKYIDSCLQEVLRRIQVLDARHPVAQQDSASDVDFAQSIRSNRPIDSSQLVRDTYLHFPGVFEPFVGLDESEGLRQWAIHLADLWAGPRQHSAPSDYDAAYYNQNGSTRAEFLAALRRIQAAVWLALRAPGAEIELFEGRGLIPDEGGEELRGEALMTLATRGTARLLSWLDWREQQPARQLLTVLSTIEFANSNLPLTRKEVERPTCLTVPDCSPAIEATRFAKLLAEFRQHLPSKRAKLRVLLAELELLQSPPLELLQTGPANELSVRFPMLTWPARIGKYPADCALSETFWTDLECVIRIRAEWAAKAYGIITDILESSTNKAVDSIYFHLTPGAIARQHKLRGEVRNAARRQAIANNILRRLNVGRLKNTIRFTTFWEQRDQFKDVALLQAWLEEQLSIFSQELLPDELLSLNQDINNDAAETEKILPYSDTYSPYFIGKLKKERLETVADFLNFSCWCYPGLAGFYRLTEAEDAAYFRDLITEHLAIKPKDNSPVIRRAIDWLTAQIDLLKAIPSAAREIVTPGPPPWMIKAPAEEHDKADAFQAETAFLPVPFKRADFTWLQTDKLAEAVGLTEGGIYKLGIQKKSAFTGFIEALIEWDLIEGRRLPELHDIFGNHYQQIINTDRTSKTRTDFFDNTLRKLSILFPSLRPLRPGPTNKARI